MKRYVLDKELILNMVSDILKEFFGIADFNMDYKLKIDLGLDEIDIFDLACDIEDTFLICFTNDEVLSWNTIDINELVNLIHIKLKKKGEDKE